MQEDRSAEIPQGSTAQCDRQSLSGLASEQLLNNSEEKEF